MSSEAAVMEHRDSGNLVLIEEFYADCELKGMTAETIRRYNSSIFGNTAFGNTAIVITGIN